MKNGIPHKLNGRFCQVQLNDKTLFLEIHTCEYDEYQLERFKKLDILDDSVLGSFLKLFSEPIPKGTRFLYKLDSYFADKTQKSAWEFNLSMQNFESIGFISIDALLLYCGEKWAISTTDFKPLSQTDIP